MKHRLTIALLAAFAFAAAPATLLAHDHQETGTETGKQAEEKDATDRFCVKETGSRIVATRNKSKEADKACVIGNGRVYTREEIERTGAMDVREALRRLDPAIY